MLPLVVVTVSVHMVAVLCVWFALCICPTKIVTLFVAYVYSTYVTLMLVFLLCHCCYVVVFLSSNNNNRCCVARPRHLLRR